MTEIGNRNAVTNPSRPNKMIHSINLHNDNDAENDNDAAEDDNHAESSLPSPEVSSDAENQSMPESSLPDLVEDSSHSTPAHQRPTSQGSSDESDIYIIFRGDSDKENSDPNIQQAAE